jgi:ribosome-associated toxin RatA of RatAB toxin-antitoxin module
MSPRTEPPRSERSSFRILAASAAATFCLVAAESPTASQPSDLDWIDHEALESGEIVVRTGKEDGVVGVDTAALIRAPSEIIWDVLKSCEVAPQYVSNVVSCESIEVLDDGRAELFVQTIKPIFFMPRFEHVFRLDYFPPDRIDMTRVSGPMEQMDGRWQLLPQPDGAVLLVHSMKVDPGMPVPRFILRATMRKELTTIMEAVRLVAEERAGANAGDAGDAAKPSSP